MAKKKKGLLGGLFGKKEKPEEPPPEAGAPDPGEMTMVPGYAQDGSPVDPFGPPPAGPAGGPVADAPGEMTMVPGYVQGGSPAAPPDPFGAPPADPFGAPPAGPAGGPVADAPGEMTMVPGYAQGGSPAASPDPFGAPPAGPAGGPVADAPGEMTMVPGYAQGGSPAASPDPFGAPPADPFGAPPAAGDAKPDPFASANAGVSPLADPLAEVTMVPGYAQGGSPAAPADPFGPPPAGGPLVDPFGLGDGDLGATVMTPPGTDPFAEPSPPPADPFGAQDDPDATLSPGYTQPGYDPFNFDSPEQSVGAPPDPNEAFLEETIPPAAVGATGEPPPAAAAPPPLPAGPPAGAPLLDPFGVDFEGFTDPNLPAAAAPDATDPATRAAEAAALGADPFALPPLTGEPAAGVDEDFCAEKTVVDLDDDFRHERTVADLDGDVHVSDEPAPAARHETEELQLDDLGALAADTSPTLVPGRPLFGTRRQDGRAHIFGRPDPEVTVDAETGVVFAPAGAWRWIDIPGGFVTLSDGAVVGRGEVIDSGELAVSAAAVGQTGAPQRVTFPADAAIDRETGAVCIPRASVTALTWRPESVHWTEDALVFVLPAGFAFEEDGTCVVPPYSAPEAPAEAVDEADDADAAEEEAPAGTEAAANDDELGPAPADAEPAADDELGPAPADAEPAADDELGPGPAEEPLPEDEAGDAAESAADEPGPSAEGPVVEFDFGDGDDDDAAGGPQVAFEAEAPAPAEADDQPMVEFEPDEAPAVDHGPCVGSQSLLGLTEHHHADGWTRLALGGAGEVDAEANRIVLTGEPAEAAPPPLLRVDPDDAGRPTIALPPGAQVAADGVWFPPPVAPPSAPLPAGVADVREYLGVRDTLLDDGWIRLDLPEQAVLTADRVLLPAEAADGADPALLAEFDVEPDGRLAFQLPANALRLEGRVLLPPPAEAADA